MNVIQHSHLSVRKFGGQFEDYIPVHRFLDSSKLYFHHVKHRSVLHNTYGVEIAVEIFGDALENTDGKQISVRDVAIAHLKEDLSGKVPTLNDWFGESDELLEFDVDMPKFDDEKLQEFVARPFLRSGIKATLFVTLSDLGVELCEKTLGAEAAISLRERLPNENTLKQVLLKYRFRHRWQYTPCARELAWLAERDL